MHYYQFNIGDYVKDTQHLSEMEDLAYRRMLDLYYRSEKQLPLDEQEIARLIRMRTHSDCIALVLQEFFERTADGYANSRVDKEISAFKSKSDKAKASANSRWNKNNNLQDANALPSDCVGNAKHKPLTINHKPIEKILSCKPDCVEVIEYLNSVTGSKYKATTASHAKDINGRLSQGHSVDDLKLVIDFKNAEWKDDARMSGYLRPATLFGASKFDGYLKAAKTVSTKQNGIFGVSQPIDYIPEGFN